MTFAAKLRAELETEERRTVGISFGAAAGGKTASYSVARIRDWVLQAHLETLLITDPATDALRKLATQLPPRTLKGVVGNAVRYAFLIELTDLKVGSTKMKTRWLPGFILMPQPGTFEPLRGVFEPGNDQRSASFDECYKVFVRVLELTTQAINRNGDQVAFLAALQTQNRVPYEYLVGYADPSAIQVHTESNIIWIENADIKWLANARAILHGYSGEYAPALSQIESTKLEVKVYKTDRALTGKDKTNRAKRWEVLYGDFQFATLPDCWSVERKLTEELVFFANFPNELQKAFIANGLLHPRNKVTRCPITLAPLDFIPFATATMTATHGRSDYQIGHLTPLKRGGHHIGTNIAWQSADGNRIQGDLTLEETLALLESIEERRAEGVATPSVDASAPR